MELIVPVLAELVGLHGVVDPIVMLERRVILRGLHLALDFGVHIPNIIIDYIIIHFCDRASIKLLYRFILELVDVSNLLFSVICSKNRCIPFIKAIEILSATIVVEITDISFKVILVIKIPISWTILIIVKFERGLFVFEIHGYVGAICDLWRSFIIHILTFAILL